MTPSHWALAGETIDHVTNVATACDAKISVVVAVPEARVPQAFALFGIRFAEGTDRSAKDCVIAKVRITKQPYNSQAEADPNN